jgi:hypothetical protein
MSEGIEFYPSNRAAMPTGARRKQEELNRAMARAPHAGRSFFLWERMIRALDGENQGLVNAIKEEAREMLAETVGAA